jgi:hypothetical protein
MSRHDYTTDIRIRTWTAYLDHSKDLAVWGPRDLAGRGSIGLPFLATLICLSGPMILRSFGRNCQFRGLGIALTRLEISILDEGLWITRFWMSLLLDLA